TPDGSNWAMSYLPDSTDLSSVSCSPTTGACYAVGPHGAVYRSGDRGHTWTSVAANQAHSSVGLEQNGNGSSGGRSVGAADLQSLSCTALPTCVAVGNLGAILSSANRGATWKLTAGKLMTSPSLGSASTAPAGSPLHGVSCGSASVCVAV